MTFAHPHLLWLLVAIPPGLILFLWWSSRTRRRLMTRFIQQRLLPGLTAGRSPGRARFRAALLISAVVFLILALAGPRWDYQLEEVRQRGLDIVVAIDTSKSMLAEDITPNRLARAKFAALDLMQQARSDRLGLVAFAGTAFLQCPLTIDDSAFRQSVDSLDVNTLPEGGTAIAEAIQVAQTAFKEGDNHRVLILFTDGEDHDSAAVEQAKKAAEGGMRIFTVGIGSADGELLRIRNAGGQADYIRDSNGNVVKSRLNEQLLREIAGAARGFYLQLQGARTIDALYSEGLEPLPKTESEERWVRRPRERYHWPLGIAIMLLIAEVLFPERKRDPAARPSARSAAASAASLVALTLMLPFAAFASPSDAMRHYKAGRYGEAQQAYETLFATNNAPDPRLIFNAGTAAYKGTNYAAALKHFSAALASPDVKLQQASYFNIGNTQFRLGQTAKDLDALEQLWRQAIKSFENAVALDPKDPDASHNLAFVKNQVAAIEQLKEAARQAREAADAAVRQRNYRRALEILEYQVQHNVAAKAFEDYVKKLKEIDEIASGQP